MEKLSAEGACYLTDMAKRKVISNCFDQVTSNIKGAANCGNNSLVLIRYDHRSQLYEIWDCPDYHTNIIKPLEKLGYKVEIKSRLDKVAVYEAYGPFGWFTKKTYKERQSLYPTIIISWCCENKT